MNILRIKGATRTLGEAQGYQALPVRDIVVNDEAAGEECNAMETAWMPSPEEMDRLYRGEPIVVQILGRAHPPIMLRVGD